MARSDMTSALFIIFVFLFLSLPLSMAEIRFSQIRSDARPIIPFDEFGLTPTGSLDLNVSRISFSNPSSDPDLSRLGFLLSTRDSWEHVLDQLRQGQITCALESRLVEPVFTFNHLSPGSDYFRASLQPSQAAHFILLFCNCNLHQRVSMDVLSSFFNIDPKTGSRNYLSVGKTALPQIYFFFFLAHSALAALWISVLIKNRLTTFKIHLFMLAVLILKALNLLCEAEDKSYIRRTGSAHGWDVVFYVFSFLKGISLFTLIVLIGAGWSFLKPYLQGKEKRVLMVVIPLQVVANIAQVVVEESRPYGVDWVAWKQVFLLVDVVCCCAVLFPIVWSIRHLREAARTDGKAAVNLMKLTLFRQYYIVVICFIYFTRVVVYALATITSYRYAWTSIVAGELATLAFYAFTGYRFRPEAHNPYLAIDDDDEEAAAEALKLEDEFEL